MLKKPIILLIIFQFFMQLVVFGQSEKSDQFKSDTLHASKLIKQAKSVIYQHPDSARMYMDTVLSLSARTNYQYGYYTAYNLKGIVAWLNGDYDLAISNYRKALICSDNLENNREKAKIYGNMAVVYRYAFIADSCLFYLNKTIDFSKKYGISDMYAKGMLDLGAYYLDRDNFVDAAKNFINAKEYVESAKDSNMLVFVYSALGNLYAKVNRFEESRHFFFLSIDVDEKNNNVNIIANVYTSLGELYFRIKHDYDSAVYFYKKSVDVALPYQKQYVISTTNINLGNVFIIKRNFDSAGYYYLKAYSDPTLSNYPNKEAATLVNLGIYYLETGSLKKAKSFSEKGYQLSDKLGLLNYKKNALASLIKLDSLSGNFKDAFNHYKEFHNTSDSLKSSEADNKISTLEFEKDLAQQKNNTHLLMEQNMMKSKQISNQRMMIWLSLMSSMVLLIFLYLLYYNRRRIKKLNLQLSLKHQDLVMVNEELNVTNETLSTQREQLKALNITKDKFFSILGHDLKSPFNSLLGLLSLLDHQWDDIEDKEKHSLIQSLYTSSEKTYHLLEELLNWGKTQQGLIKCQPEVFNVYNKVKLVTDLFTAQLKDKNQELRIDIAPELQLNTDPRLFAQVIQNLTNNAIKFTPHMGTITIKGDTPDHHTRLCISDTGIGIPTDKVPGIFALDADFNRPGTDSEKSSGMGLIMTKEYSDLMGAQLTVTSEEAKGSRFCLVFKNNQ